jgi:drug/metabolite transporter (DMT)-like permease
MRSGRLLLDGGGLVPRRLLVPLSPNLSGAGFMAISMAAFTFNDSIMKWVSADMNMGQAMFMRGVFASVLMVSLALNRGALARPRMLLEPMVMLRTASELGATLLFLVALAHLPLANVSAVMQALPLAVTMGAALVFGEPVGWRRWLSIGAGFIGVMIIVRPGMEGFSVYAVYVLGCVACCAVRDLATRRIPTEVPSMLVSVSAAFLVTIFGFVLVEPMGGWSPMDSTAILLLAGAACLVLVGYQCIITAMRVGDISFIAPFRYTALLWALLLGITLFRDIPDTTTIVGATIIVVSGIYMLFRERVRGRALTAARSTSPNMGPDGV